MLTAHRLMLDSTTIIDSCWIPLSHYYYLQTLTLLAWHEVDQDAVSGTSSISALAGSQCAETCSGAMF